MYNRYIPQSDGTFRRSMVPDSQPRQVNRGQPSQVPPCPPAQPEPLPCPPAPPCQMPPRPKPQPPRKHCDNSVMGFLKQILPKNFDTGDLLVVLLLLLMSGDCAEDQNTALLTLALYLFL